MSKNNTLGIFAIVMITVTSVDAIRNLPATALFGSPLIIFFIIAGAMFLLPSALVSAELASSWPETGGVYIWVKEAFGKRFGLLAIWFQWIENVVWYPTILSFIAGTVAYLIDPALAENKFYLVACINIVFWSLTCVNLLGIKSSARFSEFCGVLGLLIPMALIIALGVIWYYSGNQLHISFSGDAIFPSLKDPGLLVSLTAVVLTFSGMEIATVHASDVKNPKRDYPVALMIAVVIIFTTMLLGSLTIAMIVPKGQLSLVAGVMQAFGDFFNLYHLAWLTPVIAVCIIIGTLGGVSNWVIAPSRGLLVAMREEGLREFLHKENKNGSPSNVLIIQAILVSIMTLVFLYMPNVNSSYWILTVMAAQLYMGMYLIMFAAAIYQRYKFPDRERPFKIPGGNFGMWLVAGTGFVASLFTFIIGFYPPSDIDVGVLQNYEFTLIAGVILMSCPPFLLHWYKTIKANRANQQLCINEE